MLASARVLLIAGRDAEAAALYSRALETTDRLRPGTVSGIWVSLADALLRQRFYREAGDAYRNAIAADPGNANARLCRALYFLGAGVWREGWRDYEARQLQPDFSGRERGFEFKQFHHWHEHPDALQDKHLLIVGEQGLGDEIMFAGCFNDVARVAGITIDIECAPSLKTLFARSFPFARVFSKQADRPPFRGLGETPPDFEIPAGSLPGIFRREGKDFPKHDGYLEKDPAFDSPSLQFLGSGCDSDFKRIPVIGLSWRGGHDLTRRAARSLTLDQLGPLFDAAPGARFIDLQHDATLDELSDSRLRHFGWSEAFGTLDNTASLIKACDLVISTCSTTVHLAGALGVPCWVLAPLVPEWRYGFFSEGMPWYPSVRIYRQRAHGEWTELIRDIALALTVYV